MVRRVWVLMACAMLAASTASAASAPHGFVRVTPGPVAAGPLSGRLIVFAQPAEAARAAAKGGLVTAVDASESDPEAGAIAAQEVGDLGEGVDVDLDAHAFPRGFSGLKPGRYVVQAVLDRDHSYAYSGRGAGDLVSAVQEVELPARTGFTLALTAAGPPAARDPWAAPPNADADLKAAYARGRAILTPIAFTSPALSAFWGRPTVMRGWVVAPPGYDPKGARRYPTAYYTHGFGGNAERIIGPALRMSQMMAGGEAPPMIWVFLDESSPTGTHEFADGVNNGPWGRALTTELIPELERGWRMDARATGRFLTGHSSGGWATLWLQVRYPKVFGGTWSTSPDSSDFHDFTGVDIYAPGANAYRGADGSAIPLVRMGGREVASLEQYARSEAVQGDYGGQFGSFDWVFSPRGPDGRPQPLFNRTTGVVDPAVAAYWREHYDIAHILQRDWATLRPDLDGKIHVVIGDADTFHLDGAARRLKAVLEGLGAKAEVRFVAGRSHFDLFREGTDPQALTKRIAWAMYRTARPAAPVPAAWAATPPLR